MSKEVNYVVITPVRNEEKNFPRTVEAILAQSVRPSAWIVVDDGSTDDTGTIAETAASNHDWIDVIHRDDRGFREPGKGVIDAFYDGFALIGASKWDFLVKLDGDLAFAPNYFAACFERFEQDASLGIGGGVVYGDRGGRLMVESAGDPSFHVRGATKIYRRACWEQIGGLIHMPGWDSVDELKANMLGWKTRTFADIQIQQLKGSGSADGEWRNWVKNGLANYVAGYHPLFMLAKCSKRLFARPYGIGAAGLASGFLKGYVRGIVRVDDRNLIGYVRTQQLRKLMYRTSIWG
jgi:biofilm PGA synthesis N-glycosyltransferase PgaC